MKECVYCGCENADDAAWCRQCGAYEFKQLNPEPVASEVAVVVPAEAPAPEIPAEEATPDAALEMPTTLPDGLRAVASLTPAEAEDLVERLKTEGIQAEARSFAQEGGVEMTAVVVVKDDYARACEVAELWQADWFARKAVESQRICPKCGSAEVETIPHDKLDYANRCKKCGCEFAVYRRGRGGGS